MSETPPNPDPNGNADAGANPPKNTRFDPANSDGASAPKKSFAPRGRSPPPSGSFDDSSDEDTGTTPRPPQPTGAGGTPQPGATGGTGATGGNAAVDAAASGPGSGNPAPGGAFPWGTTGSTGGGTAPPAPAPNNGIASGTTLPADTTTHPTGAPGATPAPVGGGSPPDQTNAGRSGNAPLPGPPPLPQPPTAQAQAPAVGQTPATGGKAAEKKTIKSPKTSQSVAANSGSGNGSLSDRSKDFRQTLLVPSGGWLHDIVVGLSDVTGLSDFFTLAIVFVGAWIVLRITDKGVSMILGLGFDLTIPLQHYLSTNATVQSNHAAHLEQYWPILMMGTAFEVACLFLIRPDPFTLIVCLKTTACTMIWLQQGPGAGAGSGSSSTSRPKKVSEGAPAGSAEKKRKGAKVTNPEKQAFSAQLKQLGYIDSEARKRMLTIYSGNTDEERPKQLERWQKADEAKKKEYVDRYKKEWEAGAEQRAAAAAAAGT